MDRDNRQQHIALPAFSELGEKLNEIYHGGRKVEFKNIKRSLADRLYRNQTKFLSAITAPCSKERFAEYTDTILRLSLFSAKRQVRKLEVIMSVLGLETMSMPLIWGVIHDCFGGLSPKTFECSNFPIYENEIRVWLLGVPYLLFCSILLTPMLDYNKHDPLDSIILAINDDRFLNRCKIFFMLTIAMIITPLLVHPVCTYQPYTSKSRCSEIATNAINLLEVFNLYYYVLSLSVALLMAVMDIGDFVFPKLLYFSGYLTELYFASSSNNKNSNQPMIHCDKAMCLIADTVKEMESCAPRPHIWWRLPPAKKNDENNSSKTIMF
jgi:hypothetical protein